MKKIIINESQYLLIKEYVEEAKKTSSHLAKRKKTPQQIKRTQAKMAQLKQKQAAKQQAQQTSQQQQTQQPQQPQQPLGPQTQQQQQGPQQQGPQAQQQQGPQAQPQQPQGPQQGDPIDAPGDDAKLGKAVGRMGAIEKLLGKWGLKPETTKRVEVIFLENIQDYDIDETNVITLRTDEKGNPVYLVRRGYRHVGLFDTTSGIAMLNQIGGNEKKSLTVNYKGELSIEQGKNIINVYNVKYGGARLIKLTDVVDLVSANYRRSLNQNKYCANCINFKESGVPNQPTGICFRLRGPNNRQAVVANQYICDVYRNKDVAQQSKIVLKQNIKLQVVKIYNK